MRRTTPPNGFQPEASGTEVPLPVILGHGRRLSARLKAETAQAHRAVETTAFVRAFMQGMLERPAFVRLVASHLHVYRALEAALARLRAHPVVGRLWFPELLRYDALQADYAYLTGNDPAHAERSPATRDYVERIEVAALRAPHRLASHTYTRYMGDLSGGQMMRRVARDAYGLSERGLSFHAFPAIPKKGAFKEEYRCVLDELPLTPAQADEVVAEASEAFRLNGAVFEELVPPEA